ncbi:MAG: sulfatase-like hydrolase/transferase [Kiritimatiellia bacterium]
MKRPNVLLLFTDQQRWDTIGAAGYEHARTPNLDRLAEKGILFENAFCNCPVCMPCRQSMLSGTYPSAAGCCVNGVEYPEEAPHLATFLKAEGYHTANIGKLHFKNHSNRNHRLAHPSYGFDTAIISDEPGCYDDAYIDWVRERDPAQVENCRCDTPPAWTGEPRRKQPRDVLHPYVFEGPEDMTHTAFVASETVRYIEQHRNEPFFCIAGFYSPHAPINPPRRFVEMIDPSDMPLPSMREEENNPEVSAEDWRRIRAYYTALVSHIDDRIGLVLEALEKNGLTENTLVLFTSDHGDHLGDHGKVAKGAPGLDSCAHVPLLASWPGRIPAGRKKSELIELVDVAPSILDFCGIARPLSMQGRSFEPLVRDGEYTPRTSAFIEWRDPFKKSWKTVRTDEFKYCVSNSGTEYLFDLEKDPNELSSVLSDPEYGNTREDIRRELIRRWFDVEKQLPLRTGRY